MEDDADTIHKCFNGLLPSHFCTILCVLSTTDRQDIGAALIFHLLEFLTGSAQTLNKSIHLNLLCKGGYLNNIVHISFLVIVAISLLL